jgi:hypothetical protein
MILERIRDFTNSVQSFQPPLLHHLFCRNLVRIIPHELSLVEPVMVVGMWNVFKYPILAVYSGRREAAP